uniref:Uncharacterized protein n=1 Tax=Klebsiella pneumoniae TaxID=573 RepID=A0A8B0SXR0_KLEPN|nr:hypothetical protein [Klebsiella pneumoniae]
MKKAVRFSPAVLIEEVSALEEQINKPGTYPRKYFNAM